MTNDVEVRSDFFKENFQNASPYFEQYIQNWLKYTGSTGLKEFADVPGGPVETFANVALMEHLRKGDTEKFVSEATADLLRRQKIDKPTDEQKAQAEQNVRADMEKMAAGYNAAYVADQNIKNMSELSDEELNEIADQIQSMGKEYVEGISNPLERVAVQGRLDSLVQAMRGRDFDKVNEIKNEMVGYYGEKSNAFFEGFNNLYEVVTTIQIKINVNEPNLDEPAKPAQIQNTQSSTQQQVPTVDDLSGEQRRYLAGRSREYLSKRGVIISSIAEEALDALERGNAEPLKDLLKKGKEMGIIGDEDEKTYQDLVSEASRFQIQVQKNPEPKVRYDYQQP